MFGWTTLESIYAGAVIAISSTTIIVKAFAEQRASGRFVQVAFGVLIIEDLIAIFLLAVLTALSVGSGVSPTGLLLIAGKLLAFLAGILIVGLLAVPRLVRAVTKLPLPEVATITAVGICFAGAYLALRFGYSVALGAFLAGTLVAESGEEKKIEHLVQPVRDVFAAIFFVAVGMMIDPRLIAQHWVAVLVFSVIVVVGKVLAVSVGAFLAGYGVRTSVQTGMSLAQIGEFSFIIAGVGLTTGATRDFLYPVAVAVSAITTLTTPWLIRSAGPAASFVDRHLPRRLQTFVGLYASWMERVRTAQSNPQDRSRERRLLGLLLLDLLILIGIIAAVVLRHDRAVALLSAELNLSSDLALWLVAIAVVALATPFALGLHRVSRALGQALAFRALPRAPKDRVDLAAAPRRAFVVTWQLVGAMLLSVPLFALTRSLLPASVSVTVIVLLLLALGIAFWRGAANLQGHTMAGAEVIVAALGKQMAGKVNETPASGTGPSSGETGSLAGIYEMIPGLGEPVSHRLNDGDYAVGRSLGQLDLRDTTDATVLVILRDGQPVVLPVGKEVLRAGDLLALAGSPEAVKVARELLTNGPKQDQ